VTVLKGEEMWCVLSKTHDQLALPLRSVA
jgi:hypothetical protein